MRKPIPEPPPVMKATRPLKEGNEGMRGPNRTTAMPPGPAPTRHSRQDVGAEEVPVLREAIIAIHIHRRIRGAALLRHGCCTERPAPARGTPGRPAARHAGSGSLTRGMPGFVVP